MLYIYNCRLPRIPFHIRNLPHVDTGIDYTHEDLKDVIWNNPYNNKKLYGEHGYDFINSDADPMDDNGHGSHCSGIPLYTCILSFIIQRPLIFIVCIIIIQFFNFIVRLCILYIFDMHNKSCYGK